MPILDPQTSEAMTCPALINTLEQACKYFDAARTAEHCGQYLFHLPRQATTYLGLGCHKVIRYQRDGFHIQSNGESAVLPAVSEPIAAMRDLLDPDYPSFWMVSPDLCRSVSDPELPLLMCVQPRLEVRVKGFDSVREAPTPSTIEPAQGWQTESDAAFIERLKQGIEILQDYHHGKMIITRHYQRAISARDPFQLFALFADSEPNAACSHFMQVDDEICSLGCSPENVFEVADGRLIFDVVAGTRGVSADPEIDASWLVALQTDPKERREHLMAFDRYKARIETLINPGSLRVEHQQQVLQLGNVRHLYSRLSGDFEPRWDWLRLLSASFPALTSYPEALIRESEDTGEPLRFYGGILGRVAADFQQAAFYLNLRAAVVKKDVLFTQGGVGVIAESEPEKELLEVKNKLSGLMKAITKWEQD